MNVLQLLQALFGFEQYQLAGFERGAVPEVAEDIKNNNNMFKKGGGAIPQPMYTPPPAAPAVETTATLDPALTPEEEMKRKKDALKSGAKSLQIPTVTGASDSGQIGTGTTPSA